MGQTRHALLNALRQDPPDVDGALDLLATVNESDLTPDALTLRAAILEAADWIEGRKARPYDLVGFLRDAADGRLAELDDHEIDLDVDDFGPVSGADIFAVASRPGNPPLPGPDGQLVAVMRARDAMVARRIAGDTPSQADLDAYAQALVALGRALEPMVAAVDRSESDDFDQAL